MYKATVSGSFRRHLKEVQAAMEELGRHRARILSPGGTVSLGIEEGFTYLATDPSKDVKVTQQSHFNAITKSHFLWVVCPDGKVGTSTAAEMGWAAAHQKLIFCLNEVEDDYDGLTNPNRYVTVVRDVPHALEFVEREIDEIRKYFVTLPGFRVQDRS
jgi:hypothetical protein